MPKLSVVIITLNEEKNIARCLESVKDVADEIVIVDSFSKDRTAEICKAHNVRFIQHEFEGHIEQKNWAIDQASNNHVLSLDADEVLSPRLKNSILEAKDNWKYDGYYFNRLTNYCGKWIRHTSWYPARKLRLWDRSKGRWGGVNPHDKFKLEKGATKKFLKGDLLHYSYYSINEHITQINNFSTIVANAYFKENKRASYFNIIFHPVWRVFRDYIIKLGFLDGFYGLVVSVNSSHETFLKYIKLRNLIREKAYCERNKICFCNSVITWGGGEKWHYDMAMRLHSKNFPVLVMTNRKSEIRSKLINSTIPVINFRITNLSFLNPFKILVVARAIKKAKINTIILNLSTDLKVAGIASKLVGVPNVVYRRGSAIPIRNTILNRFLFKYIVDEIIANSEETKRTILSRNPKLIDENKIKIIYNGINIEKFDAQNSENSYIRKGDEVIIGNAGRLVKQKGQKYLIDLGLILQKHGINFKIIIAGEGKMENELRNLVRKNNLEDRIEFIGFIEDMKSFMQSIDIFALTSIWEGFGYVIVEAMACRKPVVAFRISSNPEVIRENVTGFMVEPFDIISMADKIIQLIENRETLQKMGSEGRKRVEEIFTFNKTLENVEIMIDRLQRKSS
jgi:glycosyltransferase involved in cell wall biosynthesis